MVDETAIAMAEEVSRDFATSGGVVRALRGVSLGVRPGELIALRGRSGSGKTTLLNILTGLDNPTTGRVRIAGQDLAPLNETARALLRRQYVGVMFQNAHLFPVLTAQENVEVPLRLGHVTSPNERSERARRALELVGLLPRAEHRGAELSGGEQQRAALARALVTSPRFLVADEPTGNLDSQTGRAIAALLREVAHGEGIGMLIATHDATIAATADRVLQLHDGALSDA
ncbi:MAG TPA: ABC transporter ATP-binding protein [Ktedonobacterales bacterium]|nr:ABC transporter ATP-binding protein [Ktedonobacterales bacterium]